LISRYDVSGPQGEFEPGSNGQVLKNLPGIHSVQEMDDAEARALEKAMLDFSLIAEEKKQAYFAAVQAGLDRNYKPMERLLSEIIERSLALS